ncbi:MAG: hypothetical protein Q8K60_01885 [Parachlamydiaceae bacterium]|nr:hypothetical protein [Parachlamydiaceae bacterium]
MKVESNYIDYIIESQQNNIINQEDMISEFLTNPFVQFFNNQSEFEHILKKNYLLRFDFNDNQYLKFEDVQINNSDGLDYVLHKIKKSSIKLNGLVLKNITFSSLNVMQHCWKSLSEMDGMIHLELVECDFLRHLSWEDHVVLRSKLITLSVTFKSSSFLKLVPAYANLLDQNELIQSLQFNDIDFFDENIAKRLSELLLSCPHLKDLKFENCIFSNQSVSVFNKMILNMESLNSLTLKNMVGFDDEKLDSHYDFLQHWRAVLDAQKMTSLDLSHNGECNKKNDQSLKFFFKEPSCSLEELKLASFGIEKVQVVFDILKNQPKLGMIDLSNNDFQKEEFIDSLFGFLLNANPDSHGKILVLTFTGRESFFKDKEVIECCQHIEDEQKIVFNFKEIDPQAWLFQIEENRSNNFTRQDTSLQSVSILDHSIVISKPVENDNSKMWINMHLEQLKNELNFRDALTTEWIVERKKRYLNIFPSKYEKMMNRKFFEMLLPRLGFEIVDSKDDVSLFIYYKIMEVLIEQPDQLFRLGISFDKGIYQQIEELRSLAINYLINNTHTVFREWIYTPHLDFEEFFLKKGIFSASDNSNLIEQLKNNPENSFVSIGQHLGEKWGLYLEDLKSGEGEIEPFEITALGLLLNRNIHIISPKQYFKKVDKINDVSLFYELNNEDSNSNLYFYKKNGYYYRLKKIN